MKYPVKWLLEGDPWVAYSTRRGLLDEDISSSDMKNIYMTMENDPLVSRLLNEMEGWGRNVVNNHKNPSHLYHKLNLLADMGLTLKTPQIAKAVETILCHRDVNGVPQVLINVPKHFGGTGRDDWGWALCDAPVLLYTLLKLGMKECVLESGISHLVMLAQENGWPCAVSPELGKFRGPGRKDDPCPYATLRMVKLLQCCSRWKGSAEALSGAEALLGLWERSLQEHPYMFYMGTDFRKLKAPLIWYDIVSVSDVLACCPQIHSDKRFKEMLDCIMSKADANGYFTPESVYLSMKDWEFGQKKEPSRWLTLCIYKLLKQAGVPMEA